MKPLRVRRGLRVGQVIFAPAWSPRWWLVRWDDGEVEGVQPWDVEVCDGDA